MAHISPVHTSDADEPPAVDGAHFHAGKPTACAADVFAPKRRRAPGAVFVEFNLVTSQHPRSCYRVISVPLRFRGRSRIQQVVMAEMDAPRVVDDMLIIEKQKSKNIFQEIWGLAEISEIILKSPQVPNLSPPGGNPRFFARI